MQCFVIRALEQSCPVKTLHLSGKGELLKQGENKMLLPFFQEVRITLRIALGAGAQTLHRGLGD